MVGNKAQKAIAAALTGMLAFGSVAPAMAATSLNAPNNTWIRLDGSYTTSAADVHDGVGINFSFINNGSKTGQDRYDTMLDALLYNVEQQQKWVGVSEVVLVSGEDFADSLSASGLAGILNDGAGAPVILTKKGGLSEQAAKALTYMALGSTAGKLDVYIVGGTAAVDCKDEVEALSGTTVTVANAAGTVTASVPNITAFQKEFAGTDRMDTSLKVADFMEKKALTFGDEATIPSRDIYVANGSAWADALSVSSFAYVGKDPLLLTAADGSLSDAQMSFLQEAVSQGIRLHVIGGPAEAAAVQLQQAYGTGAVDWISGKDRYATSAKVIETFSTRVTGDAPIVIATGENYPDALVAGPFIGANGGALVLMGDSADLSFNAAIKNNIGRTPTAAKPNYVIGGLKAVDAEDAARAMRSLK